MTVFYFALVVLLPLGLAAAIVLARATAWPLLALMLFTAAAVVGELFLVPWDWWSYWALALIGLVTIVATLVGIVRLRRLSWRRPSTGGLLMTSLFAIGAAALVYFDATALNATRRPATVVALEFPLQDGVFAVTQGGSGTPLQAGHTGSPSQQYAVDLVKISRRGIAYGAYLDRSSSRVSLNEPVYSPCSGEVAWARDSVADEADLASQTPAGNVVAIACQGVIVSLAHLRKGSVTVNKGDRVNAGQLLGALGNSGRSRGAHLHLHAERGPFKGDHSDNPGVAMTFDDRFLWTNRIIFAD